MGLLLNKTVFNKELTVGYNLERNVIIGRSTVCGWSWAFQAKAAWFGFFIDVFADQRNNLIDHAVVNFFVQ